MHPSIRTLQVRFGLPLKPHQLPRFRGAVAEDAGWEQELFHNHAPSLVSSVVSAPLLSQGEQAPPQLRQPLTRATLKYCYAYRYPRIQYRVQRGQAAIWGVNEGASALRRWLLTQSGELNLGHRPLPLLIDHLQERQHQLHLLPEMRTYRLLDYLPFKPDNYRRWVAGETLAQRIDLLERTLTGHLLGFCTAMGYQVPNRGLRVELLDLRGHRPVRLHGTEHLAFGLLYRSNLNLPPEVALGRGVAFGFGVQRSTRS